MSEAPAGPPPQPAVPSGFPFRPIHFLYAAALFASAVVTFGCLGIPLAVLIISVWAYVFFTPRSTLSTLLVGCLVILLLGFLPGILETMLQPSWPDRLSQRQCRNNLKQIGRALHHYHEDHDMFPPAYIAGKNGMPMHSWRVLLLPYVDRTGLYNRYNFHEPWDGPSNRKLLSDMPAVYACPEMTQSPHGHGNCTSYVFVVGPRTASPGPVGRKINNFKDGISDTILVIESNAGSIHWTEPRDLSVEEALDLLASPEPPTPGRPPAVRNRL